MDTEVSAVLERARAASKALAASGELLRRRALEAIEDALHAERTKVLSANAEDMAAASGEGISGALLDRLLLDETRFEAMLRGLREVAALPDPLSEIRKVGTRPNGLEVFRSRVAGSQERKRDHFARRSRGQSHQRRSGESCATRIEPGALTHRLRAALGERLP